MAKVYVIFDHPLYMIKSLQKPTLYMHAASGPSKVCSNEDLWLTLTYFSKASLVICVFDLGKTGVKKYGAVFSSPEPKAHR